MSKKKTSVSHKIFSVIGIVLCVILLPILIINVTLIIKSFTNKDDVPSVGGYFPMIVLTDSMYPDIKSGDLIICHTIEAEDVKVEDVISFFDPAGNGSSVVTHRVKEILEENGKISFRTKGDNNNTEDRALVPAENLVEIYEFRIAGAGNIAMFMQTTPGLIVCVVLPVLLLIGYDVIRRRVYEKKNQTDTAALLAELEALKAEKNAEAQREASPRANKLPEPQSVKSIPAPVNEAEMTEVEEAEPVEETERVEAQEGEESQEN